MNARKDKLVCGRHGGMKFDSKPPSQKATRLEFCNQYQHNTCCNSSHIDQLKRSILETRVAKFNDPCRELTETIRCSVCHPYVGTGNIREICPSLCQSWYDACKIEYYAVALDGSLSPCYGDALICSPLYRIVSSGSQMCQRMGYSSASIDDDNNDHCFDGTVPLEVGVPEVEENSIHTAKRMFFDELANPTDSGKWGILVALWVITLSLLLWRKIISRRSLDVPLGGHQLTLDEVRGQQQLRYQNLMKDESESEEETEAEAEAEAEGEESYSKEE